MSSHMGLSRDHIFNRPISDEFSKSCSIKIQDLNAYGQTIISMFLSICWFPNSSIYNGLDIVYHLTLHMLIAVVR